MKTIILRFSEYEFPQGETTTVAEHQRLIDRSGSCWWGWWKKKHEPWPEDALKELQNMTPIEIGLLDRTNRQFFAAECKRVIFHPAGLRMPSPDIERTPDYYAMSSHPAWFELTRFESLDFESFLERFGAYPEGDPSFFSVISENGGYRLEPEMPTPRAIDAPGDVILHISDAHFGSYHGFPLVPDSAGFEHATLLERIVQVVEMHGEKIGVAIVSGDLTSQGETEPFIRDGLRFLRELGGRLGLPRECIVVVPGNHDIWLDEGQEHPTFEYGHEDPYRALMRAFHGADLQEIESLSHFETPGSWKLSVVALNSVRLRDRKSRNYEYGYVGHRSDRWLAELGGSEEASAAELYGQKVVNLVVLHHHLLPVEPVSEPTPERPTSLTLDAGKLIDSFSDASIHACLHGHQHLPFLGAVGRARERSDGWVGHMERLFVCGAGSAGARADVLHPAFPMNSVNLYSPRDTGLSISVYRYNSGLSPNRFVDSVMSFG